jgi:2,4-dienoyl-CoA reductase-like NADH-dependent reductase (Old Yellow Enzyme family)/thioredoxin reductase
VTEKEDPVQRLFQEVTVGALTLPNRLLMAPVKTALGGTDGKVSDRLLAYYRRRAEGGVGAIIVEPLFVDPRGKEHPRQLGAESDDKVEGLARLVDAIHGGGARAIAHLNHAGRAANPKASGRPPEAPSEMVCASTGARAEAISEERIAEVVAGFGAAAGRARSAGFDAVELQCGLGYLIAQFLSPRTNLRSDRYGGSPEARARFGEEVIGAVQAALGGLPLGARISGSEQVEGGLTAADAGGIARWLEARGVAVLHVVSGSACDSPAWYYQHMSMPGGLNARLATQLRGEVGVPVIAAGRLGDPEEMLALVEGGVELLALGRALVADPDLPRKLRDGHPERVLHCGGCLQGCLTGVKSGAGIGCIVNPEVGHEGEPAIPTTARRRVVVVGGGPAGLTAARVAAERGHQVTLLERSALSLGGQFALSHLAPGKARLRRTVEALVRLAEQSGAEIRRGVEATSDDLASLRPDLVVLATGAEPVIPKIPGLQGALTGEQVLSGGAETGARVLVIGGGLVGIEVAEHLAARGATEVTVVEMLAEIARDMEPITRKLTLGRLAALPVTILTETQVLQLSAEVRATIRGPGGERELGPFDAVVVAVGTRSHDPLSASLAALGVEIHRVGDAAELRQVQGAVGSAWELARRL